MFELNSTPASTVPLMIPGHAVVWSFGPSAQINLTSGLNNSVNKYMVITPGF